MSNSHVPNRHLQQRVKDANTDTHHIDEALPLLDFVTQTFPAYEVNWHHRVVCRHLDRLINGDITRLMLFMPPRSGKLELVSRRLPAYVLGKNPDARVMACSHTAQLAGRMNRDVQRIIDSNSYAQLFPGSRLPQKGKRGLRTNAAFDLFDRKDSYVCAGIGGPITGLGFDFGIILDSGPCFC